MKDSQSARVGPRGRTSTVSGALLVSEPVGHRGLASIEQSVSTNVAAEGAARDSVTLPNATNSTRDSCTQTSSVCSGTSDLQALSISTKINRGTIEILQSDQHTNHHASQNNNQQQKTSDPGFRALTGRGLEGPRPPMYCLRVLPEPLYKIRIYSNYESSRVADSNAMTASRNKSTSRRRKRRKLHLRQQNLQPDLRICTVYEYCLEHCLKI